MLIVNFFGAPGAGKSTGAAYVFSRLKMAGVKCELATEFAKDAVWENNQEVLRNQIKILGEQYFKITRCEGKVDVLVTDSPLINCYYYNSDRSLGNGFKQLVFDLFGKYENMNFFINRTKPYVQEGRVQDEEESNIVGEELKDTILATGIPFEEYNGDIEDYDKITQRVLSVMRNRGLITKEIAALDPFADRCEKDAEDVSCDSFEVIKKPTHGGVSIYTDGACSGNPGPGGWGAVIISDGVEHELSGSNPSTTNNRMELTAVISALQAIESQDNIKLMSDSKYVCSAINNGWLDNWVKNGWKTASKKPVLNKDLWEELLVLLRDRKVDFSWVKGHHGNKYNERCDALATSAIG